MASVTWSPKQIELITAPYDHTIDWMEGTPRSGKTTAAVARFADHLIKSRDTNHLVTAYSAEQAYRLIIDGDGFGLIHTFAGYVKPSHDDEGAHLLITLPGSQVRKVYWKGGGKADSHKSITGMSLGSVYFCEINLLHCVNLSAIGSRILPKSLTILNFRSMMPSAISLSPEIMSRINTPRYCCCV